MYRYAFSLLRVGKRLCAKGRLVLKTASSSWVVCVQDDILIGIELLTVGVSGHSLDDGSTNFRVLFGVRINKGCYANQTLGSRAVSQFKRIIRMYEYTLATCASEAVLYEHGAA